MSIWHLNFLCGLAAVTFHSSFRQTRLRNRAIKKPLYTCNLAFCQSLWKFLQEFNELCDRPITTTTFCIFQKSPTASYANVKPHLISLFFRHVSITDCRMSKNARKSGREMLQKMTTLRVGYNTQRKHTSSHWKFNVLNHRSLKSDSTSSYYTMESKGLSRELFTLIEDNFCSSSYARHIG